MPHPCSYQRLMRLSLLVIACCFLHAGLPAQDASDLWKRSCRACHGASGAADTAMGKRLQARDLTDPAVQKALTGESIRQAITQGKLSESGQLVMPGFGKRLSSEEIEALVQYVRSLSRDD